MRLSCEGTFCRHDHEWVSRFLTREGFSTNHRGGAQLILTTDLFTRRRRTSHLDRQVHLLVSVPLKVTSIQFCAMRYVSCNACCRAVQPVTSTKEVAFLVLASVVEFRSTINVIDKILTRSPTLHHMAFGTMMAQAQTALHSLLKERHNGANSRLLTTAHHRLYVVSSTILEHSTTSNVSSLFCEIFLQLRCAGEDHGHLGPRKAKSQHRLSLSEETCHIEEEKARR
jgi:hypothetical protein